MATMTKAPDFYGWYQNSNPNWTGWTPWYTGAELTAYLSNAGVNYRSPVFRLDLPTASTPFSSVTAEMQLENVNGGYTTVPNAVTVRCTIYEGDVATGAVELNALEFTVNGAPGMDPVTHRFSFPGLSGNAGAVSIEVEVLTYAGAVKVSNVNVSVTYTLSSLVAELSPSTVYTGDNVNLTFQNRLGQTLTVGFWYSDTLLETETINADATAVLCPASWFTTAGVTGSSMRVDVKADDALGRRATADFTLLNPQGSTATPIAPRSTRMEGAEEINFAWQVSTNWGTQTRAELQWGTDNAVWTDLATVNGSATTWTAPALSFPAGTIYWRVRVRNSYGQVGPWSSGASFTVNYEAQSQVEPINSPTSGIINAAVDRTFSVILRASGAVYAPFTVQSAVFYWRAGTSGAWTDVTMTPDGARASVLIPANTFPAGTVQWYAEATDNTGNTTLTDNYTLSTLTADVQAVPLAPVDTVESGNGAIEFRWFYGSIDNSPQGAAEIQTGDDGETWESLATVTSSSARSYTAAAGTFEAGVVYWRIRAKTSGGSYGPWSDAVSFVCYAAPVIQGVMADGAPWTTITWQTSGQLAYEIEVDGRQYGPFFGADARSYTLPEPLSDGTHDARVRAQNKYGLWSEWAETVFSVQNNAQTPTLILTAEVTEDVALSWTGGSSLGPPVITVQPIDMVGQAWTWASFAVDATGDGISYQWYKQETYDGPWVSLGEDGARKALWIYCTDSMAGWKYRCVATNAAGSDTSSAASWTYGTPSAAPTITVQPETVTKKTGTVSFVCGSDGSAYRWYRKAVSEGPGEFDILATDGVSTWRIVYGAAGSGDLPVSDGSNAWHIPAGAGASGDLPVSDGSTTWHMPAGGGTTEVWLDTGITTPWLEFPADQTKNGWQYFCRVTNAAGTVDSDVVQYIYGEEPGEAIPGDYYVYRDGERIARTVDPHYLDRTALGTHEYRVLNRLENNHYLYSNTVTVTVTVDTLMIAPLEGGDWMKLCLSDRSSREFDFERSRRVQYVHYSGAAFPEAEIGEQEELSGSFDVAWPLEMKEQARAFEKLLGTAVVVKTPHEVVLVGVLDGWKRRDPLFYSAYEFTVRQMDWGDADA